MGLLFSKLQKGKTMSMADVNVTVLEKLCDERCHNCVKRGRTYATLYLRYEIREGITRYDVKCEGCKFASRWVINKELALKSFYENIAEFEQQQLKGNDVQNS